MFYNLQSMPPRVSPMLAVKADVSNIKYPVLGSAKLDGVRCLGMNGHAMSRSMLLLPNKFLQNWYDQNKLVLNGLDGELIVDSPTATDCYSKTVSGIMTAAGTPNFTYFVFDKWDISLPYTQRLDIIKHIHCNRVVVLPQQLIETPMQLKEFENTTINLGYEGVILRNPNAPYKFGKSTISEGYLLKIKRFEDAEATIVGYKEEMFNGNEATISEIGKTKRSSHSANKTGKGTLGAWIVTGLTAFPGVSFQIGTGMNDNDKKNFWIHRDEYIGKIVKYKYFTVGTKIAPRHPIFLGFRNPLDM